MRDKYHLRDEEADQEQNQQHQNYSLTQEYQEFYLVNNNNTDLEAPSSSFTAHHQEENTMSLVYNSSPFHNYPYDSSQWDISQQHHQANYYPFQRDYTGRPNNYIQQSYAYSQEQYNLATPTGSIHSVNASLDNTYFSRTPSTTGNTPTASVSVHQTNYFPSVQSEEHQGISIASSSNPLPQPVKQGQDLSLSSSPAKTPIPSPIIPTSSKRKRRASTAPVSSSSNKPYVAADTMTKKRQKVEYNEEESEDTEGKGILTVNQLEKELSFLKDDCATILIMLDSLRNAFLAGESSVQGDKASDKRRRSKTVAQNTEMQREMRIAYDDLMLQVRQLEKKIEKLEKKSRHLVEDSNTTDDVVEPDNMPIEKRKKRKTKR